MHRKLHDTEAGAERAATSSANAPKAVSQKAMYTAIGNILKQERQDVAEIIGEVVGKERKLTDEQLEDLADKIAQIPTSNHVIKSTTAALLTANLGAMRAYADGILLKKSKSVSGKLPEIVKASLK